MHSGHMPHVAFYRVVTDTTVIRFPGEGSTATTQDVTFNATNDIVLNESEARPILGLLMDPGEDSKVKLDIFIRDLSGADRKITTWNLSGGTSRYSMEPIKPEWVRKGDNKIIFKADVDRGSLEIRNIIVFFQRNV